MKVIRFEDENGVVRLGGPVKENMAWIIDGDLLGCHRVTNEMARVCRLMAPPEPGGSR